MNQVQTLQGIRCVVIGGDTEWESCDVVQFYADKDDIDAVCELADEGGCSDDGNWWGAGDFGSPVFCTNHYFPVEQLGYEFYVSDCQHLTTHIKLDSEQCEDCGLEVEAA